MGVNTLKAQEVRSPAVAGTFYSDDPEILSQEIFEFLAQAPKKKIEGKIVSIISPHAGYIYSGAVAAHAYKLIEGKKFDSVIVIAPSHHVSFNGVSIYHEGGYQTPLGIVPIDSKLSKKMMEQHSIIHYLSSAHTHEHSLEVQLPFLQTVLQDFKLVPIVMGNQNFKTCEILSQAIFNTIEGKNVIIIASSDLSHFHTHDQAGKLDKVLIDLVNNFDPEGLARELAKGNCQACGGGPIITAMLVAKKLGADKGKCLKYTDSGDVTKDRSRVVGYLAGILYKSNQSPSKDTKKKKGGTDLGFSEQEKKFLRRIAKSAIECKLENKKMPSLQVSEGRLKEKRGAFVTLHEHGRLKGCIGYIEPIKPLFETIREMALSAAFSDSRFTQVDKNDLKDLEIEISVLSPLKKIDDIRDIEVGKHGIYITKKFYSGLLLPQVATENNWDRKTFLEHACIKAGIAKNSWNKKGVEIYTFSADIF